MQPWCFATLKAINTGLDRKLNKYENSAIAKKNIKKVAEKASKTYLKKVRYMMIYCEHAGSKKVTASQYNYLSTMCKNLPEEAAA